MSGALAVVVAAIAAWGVVPLQLVGRTDVHALRSGPTVSQKDEVGMPDGFEETVRFWRKDDGTIGWRLTAWLPSGCHRLIAPPALVVDEVGRSVASIRLVVDPGPCAQAFTERTVEGEFPVRVSQARFLLTVTDTDDNRLFEFEGRW